MYINIKNISNKPIRTIAWPISPTHPFSPNYGYAAKTKTVI